MVRIQGPTSDYDRLDALVRQIAETRGLHLDVTGWTRRTYDLYSDGGRLGKRVLLVRIESFATTSGEIRVFDDAGLPIAEELGGRLERDFGIAEAVVHFVAER
jgi:hypothetical protein